MESVMPIVNYVLQFDLQKLDDNQKKYCYGKFYNCNVLHQIFKVNN